MEGVGGKFKKEGIYVYIYMNMADSIFCMAETTTPL